MHLSTGLTFKETGHKLFQSGVAKQFLCLNKAGVAGRITVFGLGLCVAQVSGRDPGCWDKQGTSDIMNPAPSAPWPSLPWSLGLFMVFSIAVFPEILIFSFWSWKILICSLCPFFSQDVYSDPMLIFFNHNLQ